MAISPWYAMHLAAILASVLALQAAPARHTDTRHIVQSSASHPISPVAVATWRTRALADGASEFDLIVLWRGKPGWFTSRSGQGVQAGGSTDGSFRATTSFGGVELEVRFEPKVRVAWIQGKRVTLGDANVILVDRVDSPQGAQVVGTVRVAAEVAPGSRPMVGRVLGNSPELVSFLQCGPDSTVPEGMAGLRQLCSLLGAR